VVNGPLTTSIVTSPTHGTLAVNHDPNGLVPDTITYTPAAGWSGSESFTYRITDANSNTTTANVEVTVVNLKAVSDEVEAAMNAPVTISVLANDIGTGLTIASVTQPSFGTAAISGANIVYTPNAGFIGPGTKRASLMARTFIRARRPTPRAARRVRSATCVRRSRWRRRALRPLQHSSGP